jgi:hypothetical protein
MLGYCSDTYQKQPSKFKQPCHADWWPSSSGRSSKHMYIQQRGMLVHLTWHIEGQQPASRLDQ